MPARSDGSRSLENPVWMWATFPSGSMSTRQGIPNLESQSIDTYELSYIYRQPEVTGRFTLFQSSVDDYIAQGMRRQENVSDYRFRGVELEADHRIDQDWNLRANVTYFDFDDLRDVRGLHGAARRIANLAVLKSFGKGAVLSARVNHVGDRPRLRIDPRPPLAGYTTADLTLSMFDLFGREGLGMRLGAHNVLDAAVEAPSFPMTYLDDLPRPGRTWWAQVSYKF